MRSEPARRRSCIKFASISKPCSPDSLLMNGLNLKLAGLNIPLWFRGRSSTRHLIGKLEGFDLGLVLRNIKGPLSQTRDLKEVGKLAASFGRSSHFPLED